MTRNLALACAVTITFVCTIILTLGFVGIHLALADADDTGGNKRCAADITDETGSCSCTNGQISSSDMLLVGYQAPQQAACAKPAGRK